MVLDAFLTASRTGGEAAQGSGSDFVQGLGDVGD